MWLHPGTCARVPVWLHLRATLSGDPARKLKPLAGILRAVQPLGPDTERSVVRSRLRRRTLIMLSSLGQAYPRQLAQAVGIDCSRLKSVMAGRPPGYSREDALTTVGLAEARVDGTGRVYYAITSRGMRKARSLLKRADRRRAARERDPFVASM